MLKITVKTPIQYVYNDVTIAEWDLIHYLYNTLGQKVPAIKFIRGQYNMGLKEAKDLCDTIAAQPRMTLHDGSIQRGV